MSISLQQLNEYLTVMCGTFRQAAPGVAVQRVILGQVGHLPAEFFDWACGRLAELDQLPRNLGKTLAAEFWPEWRSRRPELAARERRVCGDCSGRFDVAGYGFYAWAPDGAGGWWEYFLPCRCMSLPAGFKGRARTKREALDLGWKLAPPDWPGSLQEFSYRLRHGRALPKAGERRGGGKAGASAGVSAAQGTAKPLATSLADGLAAVLAADAHRFGNLNGAGRPETPGGRDERL